MGKYVLWLEFDFGNVKICKSSICYAEAIEHIYICTEGAYTFVQWAYSRYMDLCDGVYIVDYYCVLKVEPQIVPIQCHVISQTPPFYTKAAQISLFFHFFSSPYYYLFFFFSLNGPWFGYIDSVSLCERIHLVFLRTRLKKLKGIIFLKEWSVLIL